MKEKIDAVIILPFCDHDVHSLEDTLSSITYHLNANYIVGCLNDCKNNQEYLIKKIRARFPSNKILFFTPSVNEYPKNSFGSLFCKIFESIEFFSKKFQYKILIKVDVDALFTGGEIIKQSINFFSLNPTIGLIGSFKKKADGAKRSFWQWGLYLIWESLFCINRPSWSTTITKALRNGYWPGAHILGGCCIYSESCIQSILENYSYTIILRDKFHRSRAGEDVIMSVFVYANGYKLGEFGRPQDPLAIAHKNLPIAKERIITEKKQIIHSVKKGLHGESETELRKFFKNYRENRK